MTTVADQELRTLDELVDALGCGSPEGLEQLLCQTHDLALIVEECPGGEDPAGCLRLRAGDCGLRLTFPTTLARFWDEVDQLEACAMEELAA